MSGVELAWAGRLAYTQIKRQTEKGKTFPVAKNARPLDPNTAAILAAEMQKLTGWDHGDAAIVARERDMAIPNANCEVVVAEKDFLIDSEKSPFFQQSEFSTTPSTEAELPAYSFDSAETTTTTRSSASSASSSDSDHYELAKPMSCIRPVAILPQYVTPHPTTLKIQELGFPHLSSSFKVMGSDDTELFFVQRERPSYRGRQVITDCRNPDTPLLTVRKLANQRPVSYWFADNLDNDVLEIHGKFYVPLKGAKSVAVFTNAVDGGKMNLSMKGSYRNKHAMVKNEETGEVLVSMSSEILNAKALLGRRRDYTLDISAGVDMILAIAMIIALDARE